MSSKLTKIGHSMMHDRVLSKLKQHTNARVAIGHTGGHILTDSWLNFQKDFAMAKDAVSQPLDFDLLLNYCQQHKHAMLQLSSQVSNSNDYLARPDLGRMLNHDSATILHNVIGEDSSLVGRDILIVIGSGLSATAIHHQAIPFLECFLPLVKRMSWSLAPVIVSEYSRVAFADKVNAILKAKMIVVLIGERPGLSSADSMSIYFTYDSKIDTTDEGRNCISNIHQNGMSHNLAAHKLTYLINKAFKIQTTGIDLKDDFDPQHALDNFDNR